MLRSLTAERARRDIEVLSIAGLDIATFLEEADTSLRRAMPSCAACYLTIDPATGLLTGAYEYGDLLDAANRSAEFCRLEYGAPEHTSYRELWGTKTMVDGVHASTGGDLNLSRRMRELLGPVLGYGDEVRSVAADGGLLWGGIGLFRPADEQPFDREDIDFVGSLGTSFARGIRSGILTSLGEHVASAGGRGPAVLILDGSDQLVQSSVGAEEHLADLGLGHRFDPLGMVAGLVAGARRYGRGEASALPRTRVRSRDGSWHVLHASPLSGPAGEVVVTIEEARPPEIIPLVVAAFDLTPRECDVTQLVLRGVGTKEIATMLSLSVYTVQDHLKAVFEKSGVRSRRELMAKVFFEHYTPRVGDTLTPNGSFALS